MPPIEKVTAIAPGSKAPLAIVLDAAHSAWQAALDIHRQPSDRWSFRYVSDYLTLPDEVNKDLGGSVVVLIAVNEDLSEQQAVEVIQTVAELTSRGGLITCGIVGSPRLMDDPTMYLEAGAAFCLPSRRDAGRLAAMLRRFSNQLSDQANE